MLRRICNIILKPYQWPAQVWDQKPAADEEILIKRLKFIARMWGNLWALKRLKNSRGLSHQKQNDAFVVNQFE